MYPNQPPQYPQSPPNSLDYLNQISGPDKRKTVSPFILWGGIGGVLLLVIIIMTLVFNLSSGPSSSERFAAYIYRLQGIEETAKDNSKRIQNSQLRGLNSSMLTIITGAAQESNGVLPSAGLSSLPEEPKTSKVATEFTELNTTLENARLNGQFDRTYARELAYQLAKARAELTALQRTTRSQSLKDYLEKTDANIGPLIDQFNTYNNSES